MNNLPDFVCPITHEPFVKSSNNSLITKSGKKYQVINGIPNLTVNEPPEKWMHHYRRKDFGPEGFLPRVSSTVKFIGDRYYLVGSYENSFYSPFEAKKSYWFRRRFAIYLGLLRMVNQQKRIIKAMAKELRNEISSLSEKDILNFSTMIPTMEGQMASACTRKIEKELFWEHVDITHPALEVGVGYGEISNFLFKNKKIEFGSEYDFTEFKNRKYPHEKLVGANLKFLPFPSNSLNCILTSRTFYFIRASTISLLKEINRVLKIGGKFAFTVTGPGFLRALPEDTGLPQYGMNSYHCLVHNDLHSWFMSHLYTAEEWREILELCGFEIVMSRGLYSIKRARFTEIFYNYGSSWFALFTPRFKRPNLRIPTEFLFGGRKKMIEYESLLNKILSAVYKKEMEENSFNWNDETHLVGGIVAIKRRDV